MRRWLIVDTIPADARNRSSANLGLEIVRESTHADICHWRDSVNVSDYSVIGFNVFYAPHILNIVPFLNRNGIPLLKYKRGNNRYPFLVAGGQGIGVNGILSEIVDMEFYGEVASPDSASVIDPICGRPFAREEKIFSGVVSSGRRATLELTRGCKYRCKFCEYSWVNGGRYREKDFSIVQEQISASVKAAQTNRINFMSTNFAGYSKLPELVDFCDSLGVSIMNADFALADFSKIEPFIGKIKMGMPKVGVESFDEATRQSVGKPISDTELERIIGRLMELCGGVHIYMIYGLPNDRYEKWISWVKKIGGMIGKHTRYESDLFGGKVKIHDKNIRVDINITNFEPCIGTPLGGAPMVDFGAKDLFLSDWARALFEAGLSKNPRMNYANCKGRFGRYEESYRLLMALKRGGAELTEKIIKCFPSGVTRSIDTLKARAFLEM